MHLLFRNSRTMSGFELATNTMPKHDADNVIWRFEVEGLSDVKYHNFLSVFSNNCHAL